MEKSVSSSSSAPGKAHELPNHLFLALNLPAYVPGKKVDGVIVLVVQQAMRVQSLTVAWKGEERVSWYAGATQSALLSAQRTLFEHSLPIAALSAGTVLQPGTYTYQVLWDALPSELPPSFEDDGDGVNSALPVLDAVTRLPRTLAPHRSNIRYAATALLEFLPDSSAPASASASASPDSVHRLTRQQVFKVVERVTAADLVKPPLVKSLSQSFLLGGAPLTVEAAVGNGAVLFAGQALFVRLLVRNASGRSVEFVTLSLHEQSVLKAHDTNATTAEARSFVHEFTRRRHVLEAAVAQSSIPASSEWSRELMLPLPLSTAPSIAGTQSHHVRRVYELHVELEVSLGSNVELVLPVHVLGWSPLLSADLPASVPVALDAAPSKKQ